jgi:hypothetical protein
MFSEPTGQLLSPHYCGSKGAIKFITQLVKIMLTLIDYFSAADRRTELVTV